MSHRPFRDDEDDTPGYRYDDPFEDAAKSAPRRGVLRRSSTREASSEDSIDGLDSYEEAELDNPRVSHSVPRPDSRSSNVSRSARVPLPPSSDDDSLTGSESDSSEEDLYEDHPDLEKGHKVPKKEFVMQSLPSGSGRPAAGAVSSAGTGVGSLVSEASSRASRALTSVSRNAPSYVSSARSQAVSQAARSSRRSGGNGPSVSRSTKYAPAPMVSDDEKPLDKKPSSKSTKSGKTSSSSSKKKAAAAAAAASSRKKKIILASALGIILIIIIGLVTYYFVTKKTTSNKAATSTSAAADSSPSSTSNSLDSSDLGSVTDSSDDLGSVTSASDPLATSATTPSVAAATSVLATLAPTTEALTPSTAAPSTGTPTALSTQAAVATSSDSGSNDDFDTVALSQPAQSALTSMSAAIGQGGTGIFTVIASEGAQSSNGQMSEQGGSQPGGGQVSGGGQQGGSQTVVGPISGNHQSTGNMPWQQTSSYESPSHTSTASAAAPTSMSSGGETTSTSASSVNGTSYSGRATWFESNGHLSSCQTTFSDTDMVVALQHELYGTNGTVSPFCGKKLSVKNPQTGTTITVTVQDDCILCTGELSLDLSKAAFVALGSLSTGVIQVEWSLQDLADASLMPATLDTATSTTTGSSTKTLSAGGNYVTGSHSSSHSTTNAVAWAPKSFTPKSSVKASATASAAGNVTLAHGSVELSTTKYTDYQASYYNQDGSNGNCGWSHSDTDQICALGQTDYDDGSHCGKWIYVEGTTGDKVKVQVVDSCVECNDMTILKEDGSDQYRVDFSPEAFVKICGSLDAGVCDIDWWFA